MTKAADIIRCLEQRHAKDLFADEVCCGPGGSLRLDAWAMARSWTKADTIGYEVKVSRSDWTNDQKVEDYKDFVHRLWVVCPWGLIDPSEVSEGMGLLWMTKTGNRVMAKRKAPLLEPSQSDLPMRSALINRGVFDRGRAHGRSSDDPRETIRAWLDGKAEDHELGWRFRGKVGKLFQERRWLKRESEQLREMREQIKAAGYSGLEELIETAKGGAKPMNRHERRRLARAAKDLLGHFEEQSA